VEKSWHHDIYTRVSSQEDKDKRKHVRNQVDTLTTLMLLKLEDYRDNCVLDRDFGRPFAMQHYKPKNIEHLERCFRALMRIRLTFLTLIL
jgi:hypothetical protein